MSIIKKKTCSLCIVLILLLSACGISRKDRLNEYLDLGQKYMTEMKYDEAIDAYNKALEIDPKNVEVYQILVNIYEFQGDLDQAKSTLERALTAVPSNAELQARYERLMQMTAAGSSAGSAKTPAGSSAGSAKTPAETKPSAPEKASTAAASTEAGVNADGWVKISGKWYFYAGGEKAVGWMQQGANRFYFDKEGVLQYGRTKIDGDWYCFNEDGAMVTGWREEKGKWYYFGPDGKMLTDQWTQDACYVGADGAMLASTTTPDGFQVGPDGKKIDEYEFGKILRDNYYNEYEIFDRVENGRLSSVAMNDGTYCPNLGFSIKVNTIVDHGQYIEAEADVFYIYFNAAIDDYEHSGIGRHKIRIRKGADAVVYSPYSGVYEEKINSVSDLKRILKLHRSYGDDANTTTYNGWGGKRLYFDEAGYVVIVHDQVSG